MKKRSRNEYASVKREKQKFIKLLSILVLSPIIALVLYSALNIAYQVVYPGRTTFINSVLNEK